VFTPVLAKHSKSFSLVDCISVGVDHMQTNTADRYLGNCLLEHSCAKVRSGVGTAIWEIRSLCKAAARRPENASLGQFFAMPSTLSNPASAHEYRPNLWGFCMMDRAT